VPNVSIDSHISCCRKQDIFNDSDKLKQWLIETRDRHPRNVIGEATSEKYGCVHVQRQKIIARSLILRDPFHAASRASHRCGLFSQLSHVPWFVCLFAGHTGELCKSGRSDRELVLERTRVGPCFRWDPDPPVGDVAFYQINLDTCSDLRTQSTFFNDTRISSFQSHPDLPELNLSGVNAFK